MVEQPGRIVVLKEGCEGRLRSLTPHLNRRFDILFGAPATGFIGAFVSHFLG